MAQTIYNTTEELWDELRLKVTSNIIRTPIHAPHAERKYLATKQYYDTALAAARSLQTPTVNHGETTYVDIDLAEQGPDNESFASIAAAITKTREAARFK